MKTDKPEKYFKKRINRHWPSIQRYLDLQNRQKVTDNAGLYHYAGNNPVRYMDPDGKVLYVCGSKAYMAAVQRELSKICNGAMVNRDTGEVTLSSFSKVSNPKGYELLSSLINTPKRNTICLGNSKIIKMNSTNGYNSIIYITDGIIYGDTKKGPQNSLICFDPDCWEGGVDDNNSTYRPPFIGLAHEGGHSEEINIGSQTSSLDIYKPGTTPDSEKNSLKRENDIREENGLTLRSVYFPELN